MSWLLIIILILLGLLFLLLEVMVIPGSTLAGILGFGMLFVGIWQSYVTQGTTAGHLTLGTTIVLAALVLYISFKTGTWKRMALKTTIDGKLDQLEGIAIHEGDNGITISRLAPAGKAMFNNEMVEVHTFGEFIDPQEEITVIALKDNKIFVTKK